MRRTLKHEYTKPTLRISTVSPSKQHNLRFELNGSTSEGKWSSSERHDLTSDLEAWCSELKSSASKVKWLSSEQHDLTSELEAWCSELK